MEGLPASFYAPFETEVVPELFGRRRTETYGGFEAKREERLRANSLSLPSEAVSDAFGAGFFAQFQPESPTFLKFDAPFGKTDSLKVVDYLGIDENIQESVSIFTTNHFSMCDPFMNLTQTPLESKSIQSQRISTISPIRAPGEAQALLSPRTSLHLESLSILPEPLGDDRQRSLSISYPFSNSQFPDNLCIKIPNSNPALITTPNSPFTGVYTGSTLPTGTLDDEMRWDEMVIISNSRIIMITIPSHAMEFQHLAHYGSEISILQ
jgi:hypothetical protein